MHIEEFSSSESEGVVENIGHPAENMARREEEATKKSPSMGFPLMGLRKPRVQKTYK
jgi:hypothetical protein